MIPPRLVGALVTLSWRYSVYSIKTLANVVISRFMCGWTWVLTGRGRSRGKKQASKAFRRKGPPLPAAAPLPHSDDKEEPPSRSGSSNSQEASQGLHLQNNGPGCWGWIGWVVSWEWQPVEHAENRLSWQGPSTASPCDWGCQLSINSYIKDKRMSTFTNDCQTHAER